MKKVRKKNNTDKTYYMVSLRPFFSMPKEIVEKFKAHGYKWKQYDRWFLEKKDFTTVEEEREFIESVGEQRWEFSIIHDVGTYDEECNKCGHKKTIIVYEPLLFGEALQGIDRCPKCKEYSLRSRNAKTNKRYREWESEWMQV